MLLSSLSTMISMMIIQTSISCASLQACHSYDIRRVYWKFCAAYPLVVTTGSCDGMRERSKISDTLAIGCITNAYAYAVDPIPKDFHVSSIRASAGRKTIRSHHFSLLGTSLIRWRQVLVTAFVIVAVYSPQLPVTVVILVMCSKRTSLQMMDEGI